MAKRQNPTLKQIAELSGFSQASVSMILNNRTDVSFSEETVRLVHSAAEKLGYARRGDEGRKRRFFGENLVAVLCPNVTNPYYASLVQAIEQAAWEKDFQVLAMNTYRSAEIEARNLAILRDAGIAGIVFAMPPQAPRALEKVNEDLPAVVIGDKGSSVSIDTVEMDNYSAGALIARHLLELGHEEIAYVSTTLDEGNSARTRRLEGLEEAFRSGCPRGRVLVRSRDISPAEELSDVFIEHRVGHELAEACLEDRGITAFVAVNDMVAYGAMDAVLEGGFAVPGDYSVCGFDNVFPSRLSPISLTTVDNYIEEKGHNAFNMLYGRIRVAKGAEASPNVITRVEYPPRLIRRGSTAAARKPAKG
jgi:LacI family transcriptional regulator